MHHFTPLRTLAPDGTTVSDIVFSYIRKKNLNFIVFRGQCANLSQATLTDAALSQVLAEYAACGFSLVSCPGFKPSPPFLAAEIDKTAGTARVAFLMDLTREAESGRASKFYSKALGALSTQVFASCPGICRLFFPFALEETAAGRGLSLAPAPGGAFIVQS